MGGDTCEVQQLVESYVDPSCGRQQMVSRGKQHFLLEGLGKMRNTISRAEANGILLWAIARLSR